MLLEKSLLTLVKVETIVLVVLIWNPISVTELKLSAGVWNGSRGSWAAFRNKVISSKVKDHPWVHLTYRYHMATKFGKRNFWLKRNAFLGVKRQGSSWVNQGSISQEMICNKKKQNKAKQKSSKQSNKETNKWSKEHWPEYSALMGSKVRKRLSWVNQRLILI